MLQSLRTTSDRLFLCFHFIRKNTFKLTKIITYRSATKTAGAQQTWPVRWAVFGSAALIPVLVAETAVAVVFKQ